MTFINCVEPGKELSKLAQGVMNASREFMALADVGTSKDFIVLELQEVGLKQGRPKTSLPKRMIEVTLAKGQSVYSLCEVVCTPKGFWLYRPVTNIKAESAEGFRDLVFDVLKSSLKEEDKNLAVLYLGNKASAQTTRVLQEQLDGFTKQVGSELNTAKKDITDTFSSIGKDVEDGVKQVKESAKEVVNEATKWIDVAQALLGTKKPKSK
jgi:hypothetical protein